MATFVFDYDGTIHDCIKIYAPAFRLAYRHLVSCGIMPERVWTDNEISVWLGYTAQDMWNCFAETIPQEEKDECCRMIGDEMINLINHGEAQLYKGALEMLSRLKAAGHTLLLLSNCTHSYMKAHCDYFMLDQYFSAIYCAEDYNWLPKHEIFEQIKKEYTGEFIIVGDRFHDMEIAKKYGLKAIGCDYGYGLPGELQCADRVVQDPLEIC